MRRRRWLRIFAMFAVMALVASGCGDDDEEATDDATEEEAPEDDFEGVTISATEYEFDAPETMEASTVNLRAVNEGNVAHEWAFVKIEDQEPEAFFEEFGPVLEGGPLPDAIFNGTVGPGEAQVQPGDDPLDAEITMTEGRWLLFCALDDSATESAEGGGGGDEEALGRAQEEEEPLDEEPVGGEDEEPQLPPHYELGMFTTVEVTGSTEPEAPEGEPVITTVDYGFEGLDTLEAGDETVVGVNSPDSQQLHHIVALEFGAGVPAAEAEAQFRAFGEEDEGGGGGEEEPAGRAQEEEEEGGPPGGEPEDVGVTFPMAPGYGTTFDIELQSGYTYVFACFIQDREGGPPHAFANDMFQAVEIS